MKGKAAVQNANRRTAEALERVAELEGRLRDEKRLRIAEVQALDNELRTLRISVNQLADERAAESIAAAQAAADRTVAAAQDEYQEKATVSVRELFTALYADVLDTEHIITIAERFGVEPADTWSAIPSTGTRYGRRITWLEYRKNLRRVDTDKRMTPARMRAVLGEGPDGEG